jgi:isoquinoline 1-oxidoreductase beta subunit
VPNLLIEYVMRNTHVPVGPWRGVNTNQNGVYMECFIEECARAAGKDSLEFRRGLMSKHPKAPRGAQCRCREGRLGQAAAAGVHRGIAQFMGYASYSAATAEVSVEPAGQAEGAPHGARAELRPCREPEPDRRAGRGLGRLRSVAALYGEMVIDKGRVTNTNFDTYEILRLAEMPKVETVIVPTYDFWGGVGEPTICVVAPAVLNAIHAATGKPVRSLPLKNVKLV